jgi:hypothetical protein
LPCGALGAGALGVLHFSCGNTSSLWVARFAAQALSAWMKLGTGFAGIVTMSLRGNQGLMDVLQIRLLARMSGAASCAGNLWFRNRGAAFPAGMVKGVLMTGCLRDARTAGNTKSSWALTSSAQTSRWGIFGRNVWVKSLRNFANWSAAHRLP